MAEHVYEIRIKADSLSSEEKKSPVASTGAESGSDNTAEGGVSAKDVIGLGKKIVVFTGVKRISEQLVNHQVKVNCAVSRSAYMKNRLQSMKIS